MRNALGGNVDNVADASAAGATEEVGEKKFRIPSVVARFSTNRTWQSRTLRAKPRCLIYDRAALATVRNHDGKPPVQPAYRVFVTVSIPLRFGIRLKPPHDVHHALAPA